MAGLVLRASIAEVQGCDAKKNSNTEGQAVALLVLPPDLWKWGMLDMILAAEETKKRWYPPKEEMMTTMTTTMMTMLMNVRGDDDNDDDDDDDDDRDDDDDCDGDGFVHESSD